MNTFYLTPKTVVSYLTEQEKIFLKGLYDLPVHEINKQLRMLDIESRAVYYNLGLIEFLSGLSYLGQGVVKFLQTKDERPDNSLIQMPDKINIVMYSYLAYLFFMGSLLAAVLAESWTEGTLLRGASIAFLFFWVFILGPAIKLKRDYETYRSYKALVEAKATVRERKREGYREREITFQLN